jgi:tetratricopeptide (TPR) repeat protein
MPRGNSLMIAAAFASLVSITTHSAEESLPCAVTVDVKAPEWLTRCEAAIAAEPDSKKRAPLQFGRAYGSVERFNFDAAVADLDAALAADPENPDYLRERAYVHGELSNFEPALADLDHFLKLRPDELLGYRERAYARHFHGDLTGAYDDTARVLALNPDSSDALLGRAEAALWLGRFDEAVKDASRAQARARVCHEEGTSSSAAALLARIDLWRDASRGARAARLCEQGKSLVNVRAQKLIGNCSRAFLDAKTGAAKADALTIRSVAWLVTESQDYATEDMRMAVAFDPDNVERHTNLGFSYLSNHHSWAANREFDRSLAIDRYWLALAGRASARANLGDLEGADKDARESRTLHPNFAASGLLADLAFDHGERDAARGLYLEAYRLGSRDDHVVERLQELGVEDPDHAEPK